jgi:Uma2 family endonuclease
MERLMVVQPKLLTVDEFEQFMALPENRERRFELMNGTIVERHRPEVRGVIAGNVVTEIGQYLDENEIGQVAVSVHCRPTDDPYNDRLPDVSFVAGNKPVERTSPVNYLPDLCVEIHTWNDSLKMMSERAAFYLTNGARMVWLIYPQQRIVEVLTATDRQLLTENDILEGGEVLPGFSVPVRNIFRRL